MIRSSRPSAVAQLVTAQLVTAQPGVPRPCRTRSVAALLAVGLLVAAPAGQDRQDPPATAPATDRSGAAPSGAPPGTVQIDRDGLRKHATFLAADELGGRYTGTPGQVAAAKYIAEHFAALGLKPLGDRRRRSFYQPVPLERTYLDPKTTRVVFGGTRYSTGFAVTAPPGAKSVRARGRIVFCGTGNPDRLPKSLKGRIPIVLLASSAGGPRSQMQGNRRRVRANQVARELERRGARLAVFLITTENSNVLDTLNYSALLPGKHRLRYRGSRRGGRGGRRGPAIPTVYLPPAKAKALLDALGYRVDAGQIQAPAKDRKLSGRVTIAIKHDSKFHADNVCAVLEGTARSKEAIIYSAHMDHMGTRIDGDAFNGADDNASGTAGLLEIAEAFAKGGAPRRSVIFLAVCGEELGLWGSHYWSEHPTWPLDHLVADINIDMIGRATDLSGANAVSATPSPAHQKFSTLVQDAARFAERMGMQLTDGDRYYRRSDHYNFAQKGVPVVFFCDGEHADYHKVTDHADRLDYVKMEKVARLAYWTGYATADAKSRPRTLGRRPGWTK